MSRFSSETAIFAFIKAVTKMRYLTPLLLLFCLSSAQAQQTRSCNDQQLHTALVTLNQSFEKQGMTVHQFQLVHIPAKTYVPLTVSLKQGKMYQFNYVVQPEFQNYSLILIDKEKNELIKVRVKSRSSKQTTSTHSFVAPYTGEYWAILTLNLRGATDACAGFSILESDSDASF